MESYWSFKRNEGTEETIEFIIAQADLLGTETQNRVVAKFVKRRIAYPNFALPLEAISSALGTKKAANASDLYGKQEYEFFVTDRDNKYELAIFEIAFNEEYPIYLEIDETIAEEANIPCNNDISSFEVFKRYFEKILKTHKVSYVINKLIELTEISDKSEQ